MYFVQIRQPEKHFSRNIHFQAAFYGVIGYNPRRLQKINGT
ncbi:hypothetical protein [Wielerella bovis]|nr:hypothetical protein [Wielerella bovis]